ncbi:hypothetical protein M231_05581 [Tremella mesenterica]|uniref:DH domain-containing protein n=1 Tax=Tremella mesenterica TaxID=5217 RepID=A0A4Q1BHQ6_TREME|nr:uncharacterized protein TREMEDRAFT_64749 [Tremella mesenterica DSM 1558]EIW66895.1 hypothetical protein TREMEDRAFT_64749 [Tremella mesenterica DSM 1558]RXK37130.1 hypothetical protein M231_05581 [Tremella mesenterica]
MISPHKPQSTSPLPPPPPPKAIDLNSSTRSTDRETGAKIVRRAFHCDLILKSHGDDTTHLLEELGSPLAPVSSDNTPPRVDVGSEYSPTSQGRLAGLLEELVRTEKSYLQRIKALRDRYAIPLRLFAKNAAEMIIPLYEIKSLFSNIELVVSASETFLSDLEEATPEDVGSICLRHLEAKTFDPYRTYLSNQEASQKTLNEVFKKYPGFASFIERTKYSTTGIGNIGLRELLMEPVQRIPRYTLLWQTMIRCMHPSSAQRAALVSSVTLASKIARCEPDEQTVRATVMYCLERNVDGFPATLFSNQRTFIDSLDVDDLDRASVSTANSINSLSTSGSTSPQQHLASTSGAHCTLFLFNDKLMIVKRHSSTISGPKVTGLDDVSRLVKSGGGVAVLDKSGGKKDKLFFRGLVDIGDIIVTDVGNGDFQMFLPRPPTDQSDRWSRPLRCFTTVHPPFGALDANAIRRDKMRFVENLWAAQARLRSSSSRVLVSREISLEPIESFSRAKCMWSITDDPSRPTPKVVCFVDESESPEMLALGESLLVFHLQPLPGGMCRIYHVNVAGDEGRTVVDCSEALERVLTTIHRYGIFKFRTSSTSAPATPSSGSHRLRPSLLNLDTISRNLFGSGALTKDPFGTNSTRRTKSSSTSRSSDRSSFSRRVAGNDDVVSNGPYQLHTNPSEVDLEARLNLARNNSRSMATLADPGVMATREAAKKRISVEGRQWTGELENAEPLLTTSPMEAERGRPLERDTSPLSVEPTSDTAGPASTGFVELLRQQIEAREAETRAGLVRTLDRTGSPEPLPVTAPLRIRNKTPSPTRPLRTPAGDVFTSPRLASPPAAAHRPLSPLAGPRSPPPRGPRTPNPLRSNAAGSSTQPHPKILPMLDPVRTPGLGSGHTKLRVVSGNGRRVSPGRETMPLKDETPLATVPVHAVPKRQHSEDQLQPRKRSPPRTPLASKENSPRVGVLNSHRRSSGPRSAGPLTTPRLISGSTVASETEYMDTSAAIEAARQRVAESHAVVKRLKADVQSLRKITNGRMDRTPSLPRSPHRRDIKRLVDINVISDYSPRIGHDGVTDETARNMGATVEKLESALRSAIADMNKAANLAKEVSLENSQKSAEVERLKAQVLRAKEYQDLLRQQLSEVQLEVDVIYEAFNTELDGMFNDAALPPDEAFAALRRDLEDATTKRNELDLENKKLKRELQEANMKREQ